MEPDFFAPLHRKSLGELRIAVLGLGLMGGSLAMGLRPRCAGLLGVDPDPQARRIARESGLFEAVSERAEELLPEADLAVLAAPVGAILALLEALPGLHSAPLALIDLGSTKRAIVEKMAGLPPRFDPLGGHPMCGKERGGLVNAEARLFHEAAFAFTPLDRTSAWLRSRAVELAAALGARPLWLDALTHDRWVAWTSLLPYLASGALAAALPQEAFPLTGPGLRGAVRLAGTPWPMIRDALATNRLNLLTSLRAYRAGLQELEALLEGEDFAGLEARLGAGAAVYQTLTTAGSH